MSLALANSLAVGYTTLGRYEETVRLDEETLEIMERVLGPEHPSTLISRNNLANAYRAVGRVEDAERLEQRGRAAQPEDGSGGRSGE